MGDLVRTTRRYATNGVEYYGSANATTTSKLVISVLPEPPPLLVVAAQHASFENGWRAGEVLEMHEGLHKYTQIFSAKLLSHNERIVVFTVIVNKVLSSQCFHTQRHIFNRASRNEELGRYSPKGTFPSLKYSNVLFLFTPSLFLPQIYPVSSDFQSLTNLFINKL